MQARFLETEEVLDDGYRKIAFLEAGKFILAEANAKINSIEYGYNTGIANLQFMYVYKNSSDMWAVFNALTRTAIIGYVSDYMRTSQLKSPTHLAPIQKYPH